MNIPPIDPSTVWQILTIVFAMGGSWAAIRADIKNILEKAIDAKASATRAHERIDDHITAYHRPKD